MGKSFSVSTYCDCFCKGLRSGDVVRNAGHPHGRLHGSVMRGPWGQERVGGASFSGTHKSSTATEKGFSCRQPAQNERQPQKMGRKHHCNLEL